ncbi:MAG: prepilin-type N-terminal cleavage/methylation domain-containing protein [Verrucomicrobia bacterium]|nr:MAG: prepilin-type N-terminal cleavage/methylation domain-containing protein [Verrucomicrobiota bacterium]
MKRLNKNTRYQPRKGFTLVELLVVITIIAVLAGLTTVGVTRFKEKTNETTSMSNMRQLGAALATYTVEKGRYPSSAATASTGERGVSWDRLLFPYLSDPNYDYNSNGVSPIRQNSEEYKVLGSVAKIFYSDSDKLQKATGGLINRSYALTPWTTNQSGPGFSNGWSSLPPNIGVRPSIIKDPNKAVVMVEFFSPARGAPNLLGTGSYDYIFGFRPLPQDPNPAYYHKNNQVVLFVNGSVQLIPGNITMSEWELSGYSPHKESANSR